MPASHQLLLGLVWSLSTTHRAKRLSRLSTSAVATCDANDNGSSYGAGAMAPMCLNPGLAHHTTWGMVRCCCWRHQTEM
jgi:hypothetical protein